MHDLGKPDPLLLQAKRHMSRLVGPRRHLFCRVRAVHCYDQCGGKRPALVSQSEWKILSGEQGVMILFFFKQKTAYEIGLGIPAGTALPILQLMAVFISMRCTLCGH